MSAQEFLALPDDGIHRELVRGRVREDRELWEGGKKGSGSDRSKSISQSHRDRVGQLLANWMDLQPEPRGEVVGGEAGFRLRDRESLVGIDVAVVPPSSLRRQTRAKAVPRPACSGGRGLSPNDTHEEIAEMVSLS